MIIATNYTQRKEVRTKDCSTYKHVYTQAESHFNARIQHLPDGTDNYAVFSKPIFNPYGFETIGNEKRSCDNADTPKKYEMDNVRDDSFNRAKKTIEEIALANDDWDCMVTLTLDREKIDRYDTKAVKKAVSKWLNNMQQRKHIKYLLIPELHKDNAIHFHGFMKLGDLQYVDSGKTDKSKRRIFNITDYKYGFSTAVFLDHNKERATNYICKYITKHSKKIFGSFYLAGGDIIRKLPCDYLNIDYCEFDGNEYPIKNANMSVKYARCEREKGEKCLKIIPTC